MARGRGTEWRTREEAYKRFADEIHRQTDLNAFTHIADRIRRDPRVVKDAVLTGMLRTAISQKRMVLIARSEAERRESVRARRDEQPATTSQQRYTVSPGVTKSAGANEFTTLEHCRKELNRLRLQFADHLANYECGAAEHSLKEMRVLVDRHGECARNGEVEKCETQYDQLCKKLESFRTKLNDLSDQGVDAAQKGEIAQALWIVRRLSAVHDLLPSVLSNDAYRALHKRVEDAVEEDEHQEALADILNKERSIARDIKQLGARIHRFHELARTEPHDSPIYREARGAYKRDVQLVAGKDREWLAGLMLQLDDLLTDLDDQSGDSQSQVDRFLNKAQMALHHIRLEIQQIHDEDVRYRPK